MKTLFLCLFTLLTVLLGPNEPQAADLARPIGEMELGKQLKFYQSIEEMSVTFKQIKHLAEMGVDLPSEGRLKMKHRKDLTWEILKPSHVLVEIDNSKVQITSASGTQTFKIEEMSRDNVARGIGMLTPWLTLDSKALAEQYAIVENRPRNFTFTPKAAKPALEKMQLELAPSGHVQRLKLFELSGDSLEIRFGTPQVKRTSQ